MPSLLTKQPAGGVLVTFFLCVHRFAMVDSHKQCAAVTFSLRHGKTGNHNLETMPLVCEWCSRFKRGVKCLLITKFALVVLSQLD